MIKSQVKYFIKIDQSLMSDGNIACKFKFVNIVQIFVFVKLHVDFW